MEGFLMVQEIISLRWSGKEVTICPPPAFCFTPGEEATAWVAFCLTPWEEATG